MTHPAPTPSERHLPGPTPDYAASRRALARHSKSFALAARLLPPGVRDQVAAVYAWCRACDDAIDLGEPARHAATLGALLHELESVYRGEAQVHAPAAAFQAVVVQCGIPFAYPAELLAGMRMDVEQSTYGNTDDLLRYAYRVAGTVGLMMCHVFGVADARALPHAAHLGIAMQLTNICRDVAEDWSRGRLYLPRDLLGDAAFAALRSQLGGPLPRAHAAELAAAVRWLLTLADAYYDSGDAGLRYLPWRPALSVRTARLVYSAIGAALVRRGYDVCSGRAVVSGRTKLRLALRAGRHAAAEIPARWRRRTRVAAPRTALAADGAIRIASAAGAGWKAEA